MIGRRALLAGMGGAALAGGAWAGGAYRARMAATETRLAFRSHLLESRGGPTEYAVAGRGAPLMMIHGTGGGIDQGLLFARRPRERFQVIAPSRFGYLRSGFPRDPAPAAQADEIAAFVGDSRSMTPTRERRTQ